MHRYQNPKHQQANGDCCDWNTRRHRCMPCHNMFTFCLLPAGTITELDGYNFNTYLCSSHPHYTTGVVSSSKQDLDDIVFSVDGFVDEQNHITNPLVFTPNGSWLVSEGEATIVIIIGGGCHLERQSL